MVGHTGVLEAAIKAVEAVDECVGKAVEAIKEVDGTMFICADHGNAEQLIDYKSGAPFTAHTTNPVPFILVNYDPAYTLREGGCLADIIPTLIEVMGKRTAKGNDRKVAFNQKIKEQKNSGTAKIWTCGCPVFLCAGAQEEANCCRSMRPRGEYGKINLPYSIRRILENIPPRLICGEGQKKVCDCLL